MKLQIIIIIAFLPIVLLAQQEEWLVNSYMQLPVSNAEALVYNNSIYILGGYSDSLQRDADLMQVFNPDTDNWNNFKSLSFPRMDFVADVYYDSIYFFGGGFEYWEVNTSNELATFALERMDLNGNTSGAYDHHALFKRSGATGHIHGDNFYIFGGNVKADTLFAFNPYAVVYDIPQQEILTMLDTLNYNAELPSWQMSELVGDDIYIFGGVSYGVSNKIWKYDTQTNTLITLPITMQIPRAGGDVIYREEEHAIYIIGGFNESNDALSSTEILYLGNDYRIEPGPEMNIPRAQCSAVYLNSTIYVFGGHNQSRMLTGTVEALSFSDYVGVDEKSSVKPDTYTLEQNYPNPFNPTTTISFGLPNQSSVKLSIYTITGEHVKTLVNTHLPSGRYNYQWDGTFENASEAPSGVYIYQLRTDGFVENKKMMLLR